MQALHKHSLSVELSHPPPFPWFFFGAYPACLCLRLGRVSISFLQACFWFLNWLNLKKCIHIDTKR